jgi:peptidoglycan/xylan/chitin deacetylase (PgdA/CDA1 family)
MRVKRLILLLGVLAALMQTAPATLAEDEPAVELPIIMYHSILARTGAQGTFVLAPWELEADLKYLSEHGYETVSVRQLIDYTEGGGELPEKPVLLSFDDGCLNNLTYAVPLLEKYGMCAVFSVVGEYTEMFSVKPDPNPNYAYLSWEEISALIDTGRAEIANHTYSMHSHGARQGSAKRRGEAAETYVKLFTEDAVKLQDALLEYCKYLPYIYTYPFGRYCEESESLLRTLGFKASFSCRSVVNKITRDPECLFLLGRFNRPSGISTPDFMEKLGIG